MKEFEPLIEKLVNQTIGLIETEYPNWIVVSSGEALDEGITPKEVYPAFYGCFDWHSAVHSHWQIVRALHLFPDGSFVGAGVEALNRSLTVENIEVEMRWVADRPNFEMPYGMAWLLTLCDELKTWGTPQALAWLAALRPMESHAVERFKRYCKDVPIPVRDGLHHQSAFSLGLVWDYAKNQNERELLELVTITSQRFFGEETAVSLHHEPASADFLSPSLAEAELMSRILGQNDFNNWLERFAPEGFSVLEPVTVVDPSDGRLAHWAGLNLSRSWMLSRIAAALPDGHVLAEGLHKSGAEHLEAGLPMADHPDYMISHWVPTFAVYLLT